MGIFFPVMGQRVNILGFVGHTVSVTMIQVAIIARQQPQTIRNWVVMHGFIGRVIYKNSPKAGLLHTNPWKGMVTPVLQGGRGLNEREHGETLDQHLLQKFWRGSKTQQCTLESRARHWTTCLEYVISFLAPTTL